MGFERLIRFTNASGQTLYGNLPKAVPTKEIENSEVEVLEGDVERGFEKTGRKEVVVKLLCPLESTPIIICIGINYKKHATEAKLTVPPYPVVFIKPSSALAGPLDRIPVPATTQSMLDYEGELCFVISKTGKNIAAASALSYVLGYTAGNDLSARNFQLPDVCGGQWCYAKSFDAFAPIGPCIVSSAVVKDPQALRYQTRVNGSVRQETGTDDMIYSVAHIIEHLSNGMTLKAGTVVMTGTPSGVGYFMEPKGFLKHGDVVEVDIEGIGAVINEIVF